MIKTIIYFHGFASSSDSNKAKIFKKYISSLKNNIELIVPDLNNNFKEAIIQIKQIIKSNQKPIAFMGSSLGGYYAAYFSSKYNSKAVLINPTGENFILKKEDIKFIRTLSYKKYNNQKNTLLLLESGDEVLNYIKTLSYFKGCHADIIFGGSHSYESLGNKLEKIRSFLEF